MKNPNMGIFISTNLSVILPRKPAVWGFLRKNSLTFAEIKMLRACISRVVMLKHWLIAHSRYYREELLSKVKYQIDVQYQKPGRVYEQSKEVHHFLLRDRNWLGVLVERDPETAYRLLRKRDSNKPVPNPQLLGFLYELSHRLQRSEEIKTYRKRLRTWFLKKDGSTRLRGPKETLENVLARFLFRHPWNQRTNLFRNLVRKEKYDHAAVALEEHPDLFVPVLLRIFKHDNKKLQRKAIRLVADRINVIREDDSRIDHAPGNHFGEEKHTAELSGKKTQKLLSGARTWLTRSKPNIPEQRAGLVDLYTEVRVPEAVPELIELLDHENRNVRRSAARALGIVGDERAVPALRHVLKNDAGDRDLRSIRLIALVQCGGLRYEQWRNAIYRYAHKLSSGENVLRPPSKSEVFKAGEGSLNHLHPLIRLGNIYYVHDEDPFSSPKIPDDSRKSKIFPDKEPMTPPETFIRRLVNEFPEKVEEQPKTTRALANWIPRWEQPSSLRFFVNRLGEGWFRKDLLTHALKNRERIVEYADNALKSKIQHGDAAAGIATVIRSDRTAARRILNGSDRQAQLAMLAAARLVRMKLPVEPVLDLLKKDNRRLRIAADMYLERLDTKASREALWNFYRPALRILGDAHWPGGSFLRLEDRRNQTYEEPEKLKRWMRNHPQVDEVLYLDYFRGFNGFPGNIRLEIRDGRGTMHFPAEKQDRSRCYTKPLSENELTNVRRFLRVNRVESLPGMTEPHIADGLRIS